MIPKLFETLITDYLTSVLKSLITDKQFGFQKKMSTELNLLCYTVFVPMALEKGYQVDSIYTDFSNVFDRVNHNIFISKLESVGISGNLILWVENYLKNSAKNQNTRFSFK